MSARKCLPETEAEYARVVATHFASSIGVDADSIYERSRAGLTCLARQLAYLHLVRGVGWSLEDVAAAFGRDHSTIGNQVKIAERRVRYDADLRAFMEAAPRPGERVFTEPSLVALYERLTHLLGEAVSVRDQIDRAISHYVPIRANRDDRVGKSQLQRVAPNTVSA